MDVLTIDFDPLKDDFKAAANGAAGDAKDQVLDKLVSLAQQASPGAGTTKEAIKALAQKVVAARGSSAVLALAKLPVDNCPAVRNVPYRIVGLNGSYGITTSTKWDQKEIVATWNDIDTDISSNSVTFDATQACKFELTPANSGGTKSFSASTLGSSTLKFLSSFGALRWIHDR